jgi:hypothetical protein
LSATEKTATGYGKIDFTYDIRIRIRKFIRENKPKKATTTKSISATVKDIMDKVSKMPQTPSPSAF